MEEWKPVVDHGFYEVSSLGRVRSIERVISANDGRKIRYSQRILRQNPDTSGYLQVVLCDHGKRKTRLVHQLVMEAFSVDGKPDNTEVCHRDGKQTNNTVENLRYGTRSSNAVDKIIHGTHNMSRKTECKRGHPLIEPNLMAYALKKGNRACKSCHLARSYLRGNPDDVRSLEELAEQYCEGFLPGFARNKTTIGNLR